MVVADGCLGKEGTPILQATPNLPPSVALRHNNDTTDVYRALYTVHSGPNECTASAGPNVPKWCAKALDVVCAKYGSTLPAVSRDMYDRDCCRNWAS